MKPNNKPIVAKPQGNHRPQPAPPKRQNQTVFEFLASYRDNN